jgi:Family of unknown function (DUF6221)
VVSDLVAFLSARLDRDEAVAKAAFGKSGRWWRRLRQIFLNGPPVPAGALLEGDPEVDDEEADIFIADIVVYDEGRPSEEEFEHIARHDPARVLREVEAKRKILAEYVAYTESYVTQARQLEFSIACLAAVYSDHPDYDPEWAV